jgi:hypothetical protein
LPERLAARAAHFPESSMGATKVMLELANGEVVADVVVAWGREIVRIGHKSIDRLADLGFDLGDVKDVWQSSD